MRLDDFFDLRAVSLDLRATTKDQALDELVNLLGLDPRAAAAVGGIVRRREQLGSTGFGHGIAIPHARSLAVPRLRVAFGRHVAGLEWGAVDGAPVHACFLVVAPPHEVSNQYLPVLGQLAQLCQRSGMPARLRGLSHPDELIALLAERGP